MAKRRRRIQRDMMMNYRPKRNHAGAALAALAVSFVLLAVLVNTAIGRYQHELDSDGAVRAREFYFTSDFLNGGTYTLAPGSTQISFDVGNHADELRFSEVDIECKVTVNPGATVSRNPGTLAKDNKSDGTVTITGLTTGTYNISVTGKGGGYSKTLSATIVVPNEDAQIYAHKESTSEYTLLTVWNEGNKQGNVTITYGGIPDNTNPNMTDWTTNGSKAVTIGAHESKVFRFFGGEVTTDALSGTPR